MGFQNFLKINYIKILMTILFSLLVSAVGVFYFSNPIFINLACSADGPWVNCVPRQTALNIISPFAILVLLILYILSSYIYSAVKKNLKVVVNKIIIIIYIAIAVIYCSWNYYVDWRSSCRAFPNGTSSNGYIQSELRCPEILNPFKWNKFIRDYQDIE